MNLYLVGEGICTGCEDKLFLPSYKPVKKVLYKKIKSGKYIKYRKTIFIKTRAKPKCSECGKAYEKDAWQYDDLEEETHQVSDSENKPEKDSNKESYKEIDNSEAIKGRNPSDSGDSYELGFFYSDVETDEDECNSTISWASSNDTSNFDDKSEKDAIKCKLNIDSSSNDEKQDLKSDEFNLRELKEEIDLIENGQKDVFKDCNNNNKDSSNGQEDDSESEKEQDLICDKLKHEIKISKSDEKKRRLDSLDNKNELKKKRRVSFE